MKRHKQVYMTSSHKLLLPPIDSSRQLILSTPLWQLLSPAHFRQLLFDNPSSLPPLATTYLTIHLAGSFRQPRTDSNS